MRSSEGARRVHRVVRFGSVPFRFVVGKLFYPPSYVRMSVRMSVCSRFTTLRFTTLFSSSSSSFSPGTTLRDATAASIDRPTDRSIMSKRSRLEVGIAATDDRGVYEDDAETDA